MKRTSIGRKIDAARLAQLVSMPGIDPRVWVSLCIVDKVVIGQNDVLADVFILSTTTLDDDGNPVAQLETVRVAADYAGNGFGMFFPPAEGDEVLVLWPDGHPDNGGVLVKRLWSAAAQPPQTAANNANDGLLMISKDVNLRIVLQGKGNLVLQVANGKVLIGDENNATHPLALWDTFESDLLNVLNDLLIGTSGGPTKQVLTNQANIIQMITNLTSKKYESTVAANK